MKNIKKVLLSIFFIILLFNLITPIKSSAAASTYGVIIGYKDNNDEIFSNLTVLSPNNSIMIKAATLCKELGLSYQYNKDTKKLIIKNNDNGKSLVFVKNSKDYTLFSNKNSKGIRKTANYQFYYDSKYKCNVIHFSTLNNIVNYQYYKVLENDYFGKTGYKGIIYYSKYEKKTLQELELDHKVSSIIKESITENMTEFDKVKAINDYLNDNCEYDYDYNVHSAYGILINGKGVCEAYARAFQLMLTKAGIECIVVSGTADNGNGEESHAWNIVKIDGNYYHVDSTWNDWSELDSVYGRYYGYFLLSDDEISWNHFWNRKDYPKCIKKIPERFESFLYTIINAYYYFCSSEGDENDETMKIWKVKFDGTDNTAIATFPHSNKLTFDFEGNWFYYSEVDDEIKINRINLITDKTEKDIIDLEFDIDSTYKIFFVKENWIYFNAIDKLVRTNIDTKESQVIYQCEAGTDNRIDIIWDWGNGIKLCLNMTEYYNINYDGSNKRLSDRFGS